MNPLMLASLDENVIVLTVICGCIAISIVAMSIVYYHSKIKLREKTKQEIAAYVAEASITPEDAERLLRAGSESE